MQHDKRISVCMASYNGSEFIAEQIHSILSEIDKEDELIIVDDCSTDNTIEIVKKISDPRINLIVSEQNLGYVKTFEKALENSSGEYIFLSDQDDIWIPGRIKIMLKELESSLLVVGNCEHFGGNLEFFHKLILKESDSNKYFRNIFRTFIGYQLHWGCAMGFKRELLSYVLPIPEYLKESHDQYFSLAANLKRSVKYLETNVVRHRLHDNNAIPKKMRSIITILRARYYMFRATVVLLRRK